MADQDEEKQGGALTPVVERELAQTPARVDDPMVILEQRNKAMERLLQYAIAATLPEHWTNQGNKPYLTSAGAQAIARRCGVTISNVEWDRVEYHDEQGPYFEYVYTGTFQLPGNFDRIEGCIGSCTSRDAFIGTGDGKLNSEVDPGDIRKKAQTNMIQRGVTQLLGLRGMEWPTLEKYGISAAGAVAVTYKAGAKGAGQVKELTMPFGRQKGQAVSTLTDKDLEWYLKAFNESLADPEKKKYHENTKLQIVACETEVKRRKDEAEKAAAAKPKSMWQRIQDAADKVEFPRGEKDADLIILVKGATDNKKGAELTDDDFKKIEAALTAAKAANDKKSDIPY